MILETQFIVAVQEMRALQKKYFTTRQQYVLRECKHAEAVVDKMLKDLDSEKPKQGELL